jgi:hypothetical protein
VPANHTIPEHVLGYLRERENDDKKRTGLRFQSPAQNRTCKGGSVREKLRYFRLDDFVPVSGTLKPHSILVKRP